MKKDWIEVELGTVCGFIGGGTPSKSNPDYWVGEIPWASIKDLKGSFLFKTEDSISEEGLKNSASNLALVDDIILATRINPGRPIISKIKVAINQDLKIARPLLEFSPRFLFYLFKEIEPRVLKLSSGTTVLGINLTNLKSIVVPLPPLPEQRAIVARIEELFSELDHAVSSLQSAQAKLEIYRQSVLKKAFEGGYSDLNLELRNLEFGALIKSIDAGKSFRCDERPPKKGEVGVLKVSAVTWGEFLEEESKTVTDPSMINEAYFVQKGDFLLSRANTIELVGNSVIVKKISKSLMLSDKTLSIKIDNALAKDYYILYFLRSLEGKKQIQQLSSGNQESMRNIGQSRIKQILIPIPPNLEEQTQIVQEIESRLSVADKLAETIQTNLQKSEALRQSILKKAFKGRLLSEAEVEACRKEADWEPAERLLARIERSRNERIKQEKSKPKKS